MAKKKIKQKKAVKKSTPKAHKESPIKLKPLGDRVLILESAVETHEKTQSGIFIPATVEKDTGSKRGVVVAVGAGRKEDGKLVAPAVAIGDTVLFQWGEKIEVDGKEYYLVREGEILGILK